MAVTSSPSDTGRKPPTQFVAALADRFILGREIGRGASAIVYLARDLKNERTVAVKVLRPELALSVGAERFSREIRISGSLTHPHILPILDSGEAGGVLYCVMPLLTGESLRTRLQRERQLSLDDALHIVRDVAGGLQHAHNLGIVHRDVKPENILLAAEGAGQTAGEAYIADFGLAHLVGVFSGERLTESGIAVGTIAYMSPEQSGGGGEAEARSDQYSLACVLFEMLAGVPPYTGPDARAVIARHRLEPIPRVRVIRDTIPPDIDEAIARAMAKTPADRFKDLNEFLRALDEAQTRETFQRVSQSELRTQPWLGTSRRPKIAIGAMVCAAALVGLGALIANRRDSARTTDRLDSQLVAVAPFSVPDPGLAMWKEGLVDLLSRTLDGAGPLRTVPPATVLRLWRGRGDETSAAEISRGTSARYIVNGTLVRSGPDSVAVAAAVHDARDGRVIGEVQIRESADYMDRLANRLTVAVLRSLGQSGEENVASLRLGSGSGANSLEALKAFLHGEYYFRRTAWDSAVTYYTRAVELDSGQALAMFRLSLVGRWQRLHGDAITSDIAARADAANHGLAPRESLMVHAWALLARTTRGFSNPNYWRDRAQLFATLNLATARYPQDEDLAYLVAESDYYTGTPAPQTFQSYRRIIAMNPRFAPAYINALTVAMEVAELDTAQRYLDTYLQLRSADDFAGGYRLAADIMRAGMKAPRVRATVDTASIEMLQQAMVALSYWPDSAESGVGLAQLMTAEHRRLAAADPERAWLGFQLSRELAFRGHMRAALEAMGGQPALALFPDGEHFRSTMATMYVTMGGLAEPDVERYLSRLREKPVDRPNGLILALPWWAHRGDSASIRAIAEHAEHAVAPGDSGVASAYARYVAGAARAYLALARQDSTTALRGLLSLPDDGCMYPYCPREKLQAAQLLMAAGRYREASSILNVIPIAFDPVEVVWRFERARSAEQVGDLRSAQRGYEYVANVWRSADPSLQPTVQTARNAAARLAKRGVTH